jgi:hypothetical protein
MAARESLACSWWVGLGLYWKGGMSPKWYRCTVHGPSPLNLISYFSKLNRICKLWNPTSCAPKLTKLWNLIEWKVTNNFLFGRKFKFQTEFELKFLEAKLLVNLHWICLRFKHWKNLVNSLKFLLALIFENVNLDWYSCVVNFVVSIHAPFDLVWK